VFNDILNTGKMEKRKENTEKISLKLKKLKTRVKKESWRLAI